MPRPVTVVEVTAPVLASGSPVSSTVSWSCPESDPVDPPSTPRAAPMAFTVPPVLGHVVVVAPRPAFDPTATMSSPESVQTV